ATGAKAHLVNKAGGVLNIFVAVGPDGNLQIPIGQVENDGVAIVSDRTLRVARSFTQRAAGLLDLNVFANSFGSVITGQNAAVGGTVSIRAGASAKAGTYRIIRAGGARTGKFAQFAFKGPPNLKARLAYSAKEVVLILENK